MSHSSLDAIGLGLTDDELMAAFEPFVSRRVDDRDPEWRAQLRVRKRRILKKGLRRLLFGWLPRWRRTDANIVKEYSEVWGEAPWSQYSLAAAPPRFSPWDWRGSRMLASTLGATRYRQLILVRLLEYLKPKSVLEVGCGNGINLLMLAGRFPETEFAGLELTDDGHRKAVEFQRQEELPAGIEGFAPLPILDRTAFKRVNFVQGSAADLPFPDGRFDLVITILSLEQMERIRDRALAEVARVAGRHTFMIEPFRDVNHRGWSRLNVLRKNYFRGRIDDLRSYGLEPVITTGDFPQEVFLRVCAVLSERK